MIPVSYYVAMSLDGFIAGRDGDISWLSAVERKGEDYGYAAFYDSVDAILLGRKTYDLCLTFPAWPYAGKRTWIFSRALAATGRKDAFVTRKSPVELMHELEPAGVRKAWLVGGGELAGAFGEAGLIAEYIVSIIPVLLGGGIRVSGGKERREKLRLVSEKTFPSGLVQLTYRAAEG